MIKKVPRVLLAGTSSGCGKTTITCGLLAAYCKRGQIVTAFKCGPDYIDPLFHSHILNIPCGNLDSFFYDTNTLLYLLAENGQGLSVLEGVMGFYDGQTIASIDGSTCDIANKLQVPTILVVNGKGTAHSLLPVIEGFLNYKKNTIQGIIFNNMAKTTYVQLKPIVEDYFSGGVEVLGYFPKLPPRLQLESRHLGLKTPDELEQIHHLIDELGSIAEETLELDKIQELGKLAKPLEYDTVEVQHQGTVTIAVARDKAFCFYYKENLEFLKKMGATLVEFSPLTHKELPPSIDGLYLGGGYPELYLEQLSENTSMKQSILGFLNEGKPCIAECGGFMYLQETIEHMPMVGFIEGHCSTEGKLQRFGYVTLEGETSSLVGDETAQIKAHEFHYYQSSNNGTDFVARKPNGREWTTAHATETFYGGYPHIPFYSNGFVAINFMKKCLEKRNETNETDGN